jgi:hypothetical protein
MNLSRSHVGVRVRFVAMIAAVVVTRAANAQNSVIWATDASVGFNSGRGGLFALRENPVAEIAGSVRKPLRHSIGLDAEVDYDWSWQLPDPDLTCEIDPRGGCAPRFPAIGGPVGLVGVTLGAADVVELRVNAGLAAYSADNTRLGAPGTAIDIAGAPMSRLAIVAGWRAFELPNYRGDRLTVTNWHLGIRLQTNR